MFSAPDKVEHKELSLIGYTIHYFCKGEKKGDLIIFLHPAFADHRCFEKQLDFFSKNFRVITLDMLGHGLSKVDKAKDKIDETINHIDKILQLENYDKAHVVGISLGSLLAQYYGLKFPEKVKSMTILGGYNINGDNLEIKKAQRSAQFKGIIKALFSMESFRRYVSNVAVSAPEEKVRFYEMSKMFTRKSFLAFSGMEKVLKKRDEVVSHFPLLIMCGDKDIELAKTVSESWHESDSNSKYCLIENAGHCANMDNAAAFNEQLLSFILQNS